MIDLLRYAILHTFGLVHAVLLTLISFALVAWAPPWAGVGCIVLPVLSFCLGVGCSWSVAYVCDGKATVQEAARTAWMPAVGVFVSSLFLLPLEMIQSTGLNLLIVSSVVLNGLVAWILQVYSLRSASSAAATSSVGSGPT